MSRVCLYSYTIITITDESEDLINLIATDNKRNVYYFQTQGVQCGVIEDGIY